MFAYFTVAHLFAQFLAGTDLIGESGRPWCWIRSWSDDLWSEQGFYVQLIIFYIPVILIFLHNLVTYVMLLYLMTDSLSTNMETRIHYRLLLYTWAFFLPNVWIVFAFAFQAVTPNHVLNAPLLYLISFFTPLQGAMNAVAYGMNYQFRERVRRYFAIRRMDTECGELVVSFLSLQLLPTATMAATMELKKGLCLSTNTGQRPSFENAHARSGYIQQKINRCGNLPNLLLTEELSELRSELFRMNQSAYWNIALYGGGPGFDAIGLVFMRDYFRAEDVKFHATIYDNEPGWKCAIDAVDQTMNQLDQHNILLDFQHCDITLDVHAEENKHVHQSVHATQLHVFSFVSMTEVTVSRRDSAASASNPDELLRSVLSEENPSVSAPLVSALSTDATLASFVDFITRVKSPTSLPDGPDGEKLATAVDVAKRRENETEDNVTPELRTSYRATMLLTNDDTADALLTFLGDKSKLLTRCLFPAFQRDAKGNLRHVCRVIDQLLRFYLDDVYDVLGKDAKTVQRYMGAMLPYLEHAPVAELFLTLVCKPHSAAVMRFYASTPPKKWAFFRALAEWKVLLVLANHVCSVEYEEAHTIGAADVFIELLDRLAADENGQLLLQPAAYCPELLEGLIRAAVEPEDSKSKAPQRTVGQRTAAMKCVFRLLQKSMLEKVQGPPTSPYQSFGATIVNLVPNQLSPLREKIYELVELHLGELLKYLIQKYVSQQNIEMPDEESGKPLPETAVRHTAYVVKVPFTELRLTLVEALVEVMAHNPRLMSEHFDANVWRVLVTWFFEYSHNNLYHAAFYQLVFIALRTDNQQALEVLVKKLKLVTLLVEHYRADGDTTSNKGYILQICNAIRLQAASQSPEAFLRIARSN
ncbi:hypothetical protein PHPALM_31945 [Phytophthora palmivora]|uniref:Transmembrane protein n=1 Tax=Phytophthora palmivora TaxID=4796 RepID=A0A2P4X1A8_9STRA|nr:hypothetical protein PHPALM_31945 [Phytophthora palmivora]